MARSLRHLLDLAADLREREVDLLVLKQGINTSTPSGRLQFHMFGAFDEFLRELIIEGTLEGLASARARGQLSGNNPLTSSINWAVAGRIDVGLRVPSSSGTGGDQGGADDVRQHIRPKRADHTHPGQQHRRTWFHHGQRGQRAGTQPRQQRPRCCPPQPPRRQRGRLAHPATCTILGGDNLAGR